MSRGKRCLPFCRLSPDCGYSQLPLAIKEAICHNEGSNDDEQCLKEQTLRMLWASTHNVNPLARNVTPKIQAIDRSIRSPVQPLIEGDTPPGYRSVFSPTAIEWGKTRLYTILTNLQLE